MVVEHDGQLLANSYQRRYPLQPTPPPTPWAVLLADETHRYRLLCFDFDVKKGGTFDPDLVEPAADDADSLSRALTAHGIAHVLCESSGTGGRHIWVAIAGGAAAELVKALGVAAAAVYSRTLDYGMLSNPATGRARPPMSPHRDGSFSRVLSGSLDALTSPTTTQDQLDALLAHLVAAVPARLRSADLATSSDRRRRPLPEWARAHLDAAGGGDNPSWTGYMCLIAFAIAGWSLSEVKHASLTTPGMEHYRSKNVGREHRKPRNDRERRAQIERQWEKAMDAVAHHRVLPRSFEERSPERRADFEALAELVHLVDQILERIRVSPGRLGRGEAAASQRSTLLALAYLTLHTGKRVVGASVRDLALLAGISSSTVAASLRRLADAGLIAKAREHDGYNAAEWQLTDGFSTALGTVRPQPLKNTPPAPSEIFPTRALLLDQLDEALSQRTHDVFSRAGIGHLAGELYSLLTGAETVTIETAARRLGVGLRYAVIILSRLRQHKLIVRAAEGWRRSKRDLRTAVARRLGVEGILERRRRMYEVDRELWAWWQNHHAIITAAPRARPHRPHVSSRPLFDGQRSSERRWPLYPCGADGRANHKEARGYIEDGVLDPSNRWQLDHAA